MFSWHWPGYVDVTTATWLSGAASVCSHPILRSPAAKRARHVALHPLTPAPNHADSTRLQNNQIGRELVVAKSENVETDLTKGQLRKLNALRKSVGPDIGERAFAQWLEGVNAERGTAGDKTSAQIAEAIQAALGRKGLSIPREGYLITRGRGRVIVTRAGT